jgi:hypothetical protein
MRAAIAYYDPPRRPAPGVRPEFTSLPLTAVPVTIGDLRARPAKASLGQEGFTVAAAPTSVRDFYDSDEVARVYLAEAGDRPAGATFTGDFAHADFSAAAAEQMLRRNLPPGEVSERLRHRYAVYNVWRAFSGPPQDVPLALCDTRTVAPEDKQYCEITMRVANGELVTWENITYLRSERHRWWYCADMTRDEAYVFRSFDSDPARAEQVPHSAFIDQSCPGDAPPRASIEIRVFAFYD